jgi:hypothetical protein
MTTHGNYNRWRGGDKRSGATKLTMASEIAAIIKEKIGVTRDGKSVQNKIESLEAQFRRASAIPKQSGGGSMDPGKLEAEILKRCPYYNELKPIMNERPNITPYEIRRASSNRYPERNNELVDDSSSSHSSESEVETEGRDTSVARKRIATFELPSRPKKNSRAKTGSEFDDLYLQLKKEQFEKEFEMKQQAAQLNERLVNAQIAKINEDKSVAEEERKCQAFLTTRTLIETRNALINSGTPEEEVNRLLPLG